MMQVRKECCMKSNTATVADVEKALEGFKAAVAEDSSLEGLYAKKLAVAVDALAPKSTLSGVFKRFQGNALKDFAVKKEQGTAGYSNETKEQKIREYVLARFRLYMDDPKTTQEASKLFYAAYPSETETDLKAPEKVE